MGRFQGVSEGGGAERSSTTFLDVPLQKPEIHDLLALAETLLQYNCTNHMFVLVLFFSIAFSVNGDSSCMATSMVGSYTCPNSIPSSLTGKAS